MHIAVQNGHVEVVEALTHKMDKDDLDARDNVRLPLTRYPLLLVMHLSMASPTPPSPDWMGK